MASVCSPSLPAQTPEHRLFDAPLLRADGTDEVEVSGDADGDGDVDLVAFTPLGTTAVKLSFRVLFNDGAGRFTGGPSTSIPANSGTVVAFGDVTGDGLPDLFASSVHVAPSVPGIWMFRSSGPGTFAAPVHLPLPGNVTRLAIADADANGRGDLLAVHFGASSDLHLAWFGDGGTGLVPLHSIQLASSSVGSVSPIRIDNDGRADVALTAFSGSSWRVQFLQTTNTGFVSLGVVPVAAGFSMNLVPGDWDLDGDDDVLLSTSVVLGQLHLTPVLVHGPTSFAAAPTQVLPGLSVARTAAGDLDGDGDLDLVVRGGPPLSPTPSYFVARVRNDGGAFAFARYRAVPQSSVGVGAGLVDLDGDARPDFADVRSIWFSSAASLAPELAPSTAPGDWDGDGDLDSIQPRDLRLQDGAGAFATVASYLPSLPANQVYVEPIQRGDFDGDGAMEVVAPLVQQILLQQTYLGMRRLEADGDDRLVDQGLAAALPLRMEQGVVDDLDGDGDLDLIDRQGAWLFDGVGTFSLSPLSLSGFRPVAKGDVDGDGDSDFLAVNPTAPTAVGLLVRTGPVQFTVVPLVPPQGLAVDTANVLLADLDDDGDLDVACREVVSPNVFRTLVLANTGGVFASATNLPENGRLAAGDVDADGLTDLVVVESLRLHVRRRLPGTFQYASPVSFAFQGASALADLDQDGDADLVGEATLLSDAVPAAAAGLRRQYGSGGLGLDARRPVLSAIGPIRSGQPLSMRVRRALGGTFGVLVFSAGSANVPDILPGLTAYVASIDAEFLLFLGGVDASFPLPPGTAGMTVWSQFVALDAAAPSGLVHSNGVELRIGQ